SCLLGVRLSQELGFDEHQQQEVYYLSLARHIGCTANSPSAAALFGNELELAEMLTADPDNMMEMMGLLARLVGKGQPLPQRIRLLANVMAMGKSFEAESHRGQCEVAVRLTESLGLETTVTEALWQIFEQWNGRGTPKGLKGEELLPSVRVIQ